MARNFPFEINADKYSRQLWSKQAYLYLAEFFRKAVFDTNVQVIEGGTIDDYRFSGPADDWRLPVGGASLDVVGTPALFKVCALVGWTLDSEGEWTQMTIDDMVSSPPTELWEGQTEPGNYLRPTWDYVRAYDEEEA